MKSGILTKVSALTLALATFSFGDAASLYAQTQIDEAKYRINIAGRQRMLSQRIAKAACFVELGVQKDAHLQMLGDAHDLFDATLKELRDGGGQHGLAPETDRKTLEGLASVQDHWVDFSVTLKEVLAKGEVSYEAEEDILSKNLMALADMNLITSLVEQEYANPNETMMDAAIAINIFGRQRMLSQKASKEFCYVASGHHVEEERAHLEETRKLFDTSLDAITNGMPAAGLKPPPTPEIAAQLAVVGTIWGPMEAIFQRTIAGEAPSQADIEFIATENNRLLVEMNKAVEMYQAL